MYTKLSFLRFRGAQNGEGDWQKGDSETEVLRDRLFVDFGSILGVILELKIDRKIDGKSMDFWDGFRGASGDPL